MTIQEKYNELKLQTSLSSLISFLKENYHFFGGNLRLFGILTDKRQDDLIDVLKLYCVECAQAGEILQCSWKVTDAQGRSKKFEFFCHLDDSRGVLQIFTFTPSSELHFIDRIIRNTSGLYYLWISPQTLDDIRSTVIDNHPSTLITAFTAKRFDNMSELCAIRPGFKRSFRYRGEDGKETLQELRNNYGVLPRTIQFDIPTIAEFRISYTGLFTIQRGNIDYVISLFHHALEKALNTKRILDSAVYQRIKERRKLREVHLEKITPLQIELTSALDVKSCHELVNLIKKSDDFYCINEAIFEGSLYFASTLVDRDKNETFKITSNGLKINIIKESSTSFASLLKFYQFVVERLDVGAKIG